MVRRLQLIALAVVVGFPAFVSAAEKQKKNKAIPKQLMAEMKARDEAILKEIQALRKELQELKGPSKDDTTLQELERSLTQAKAKATHLELTVRALQERNEILTARLRELEAVLSTKAADPKAKPKYELPNPNEPQAANPPPIFLKGKVTKVDLQAEVVEVDLGADSGLKVGHTLEVYRLQPRAEYVGMVRIVQVLPQRSVARIAGSNPLTKREIKSGDTVSSRLTEQ